MSGKSQRKTEYGTFKTQNFWTKSPEVKKEF